MAAPVFTTTTYNVDENVFATGSTVVQIAATDGDADPIGYFISGTAADNDKFSINSLTGELTFLASPDFESPADADTDGVYEVEITLSDGTNTTIQTIFITVDDVAPATINGTSGDDVLDILDAVSYTHLTLPTSDLV